MAGSVNKVILIGNVGRDPEMRRTNAGEPVVNFSIATSESWRDRQTGEKRERTEWHNVVIFNEGIAKIAEQYVRKGSKIYLEGALQTRKFTDKSGAERSTTEVVLTKFRGELTLLDGRGDGGGSRDAIEDGGSDFGRSSPMERTMDRPMERSRGPSSGGTSSGGGRSADLDDDIPF
jgi:single-strand DNA-binding protein